MTASQARRPPGPSRSAQGRQDFDLRQGWSPDGRSIAAIVSRRDRRSCGRSPQMASASAQRVTHRIAFPAWTPRGEIACVATADSRARLTIRAMGPSSRPIPISTSTDRSRFRRPQAPSISRWPSREPSTCGPRPGGEPRRLTSFSRDTYAPTVSSDGSVLSSAELPYQRRSSRYRRLKPRDVSKRNAVWIRPAGCWESPTAPGAGSWTMPTIRISRRTQASSRWIRRILRRRRRAWCTRPRRRTGRCAGRPTASGSFTRTRISRTHPVRPAVGDTPPRRISFLGRGAEVGWPRWSPDSRWLLLMARQIAASRHVRGG